MRNTFNSLMALVGLVLLNACGGSALQPVTGNTSNLSLNSPTSTYTPAALPTATGKLDMLMADGVTPYTTNQTVTAGTPVIFQITVTGASGLFVLSSLGVGTTPANQSFNGSLVLKFSAIYPTAIATYFNETAVVTSINSTGTALGTITLQSSIQIMVAAANPSTGGGSANLLACTVLSDASTVTIPDVNRVPTGNSPTTVHMTLNLSRPTVNLVVTPVASSAGFTAVVDPTSAPPVLRYNVTINQNALSINPSGNNAQTVAFTVKDSTGNGVCSSPSVNVVDQGVRYITGLFGDISHITPDPATFATRLQYYQNPANSLGQVVTLFMDEWRAFTINAIFTSVANYSAQTAEIQLHVTNWDNDLTNGQNGYFTFWGNTYATGGYTVAQTNNPKDPTGQYVASLYGNPMILNRAASAAEITAWKNTYNNILKQQSSNPNKSTVAGLGVFNGIIGSAEASGSIVNGVQQPGNFYATFINGLCVNMLRRSCSINDVLGIKGDGIPDHELIQVGQSAEYYNVRLLQPGITP